MDERNFCFETEELFFFGNNYCQDGKSDSIRSFGFEIGGEMGGKGCTQRDPAGCLTDTERDPDWPITARVRGDSAKKREKVDPFVCNENETFTE